VNYVYGGADAVHTAGLSASDGANTISFERSLAAFARAALRHGGLTKVRMEVRGAEIAIFPTTPESAPVLGGEQLRDLGAAVARHVIEAGGGSLALEREAFVVRLPE